MSSIPTKPFTPSENFIEWMEEQVSTHKRKMAYKTKPGGYFRLPKPSKKKKSIEFIDIEDES